MANVNRGLIAGASLFAALCGSAAAGPITFNDTGFVPAKDAQTFATIGGAANIYQTLNFASAPADGADAGSGVAFVNVTSFLDPAGDKIAANLNQWSVYAEIDYSVAGSWSGITAKGAGDYTSTAVTGTLELYAVSGNCSFAFTPSTAGPSTVIGPTGCSGTAVEIADGTLSADSLFSLKAGNINTDTGRETGSESFDIDSDLTSLVPSVLSPAGVAIDLTIDSGTGVGSNTTDKLVDAPSQYWCTNGSSGNCGSDTANWSADPPDPVPEPASLALFGAGLVGFWRLRRHRRG